MENLSTVDMMWLGFGLVAQTPFAMRFLWQWIVSERRKESVIPAGFWYLSLAGGLMLTVYELFREPILVPCQAAGLVVYTRNLILIHRAKRSKQCPDGALLRTDESSVRAAA